MKSFTQASIGGDLISAKRDSIVVEFMLAQYRMSRIEEITTRNVSRAIWFAFCIYLSTPISFEAIESYIQKKYTYLSFLSPIPYVILAMILFALFSRNQRRLAQISSTIRSMIVSLDSTLKDYYVHGMDREYRTTSSNYYIAHLNNILYREDFLWFTAAMTILYVQFFSKFVPLAITLK